MQVVAGILKGRTGKVFAAQKMKKATVDADPSSDWEFPGGKVEAGESLFTALKREWMEEFQVQILRAEKIGVERLTPQKIEIHFFFCAFKGFLKPAEHKAFTWFDPAADIALDFCTADRAFLGTHRESLARRALQREF